MGDGEGTGQEQDDERPVVLTDPMAIRALAHPARLAVIDALGGRRTLTATEAARIVELSPSAMSYHLRALAKWGIVREAPPAEDGSDGRERRWQMAGRGLMIESLERGAGRATAVIAAQAIDRDKAAVIRYLESEDPSADWRQITAISHAETWLTQDEARQVSDEIQAITERVRNRDRPPGARRVRMGFTLVPIADPSDQ